jgi:hypothetical protein
MRQYICGDIVPAHLWRMVVLMLLFAALMAGHTEAGKYDLMGVYCPGPCPPHHLNLIQYFFAQ